jgi:hypothetical protein
MKKAIFLIMLLFLVACTSQISTPKNFQEASEIIDKLDEKYEASFKQEQIPLKILDIQSISSYVAELRMLNSSIDYSNEDGKYVSWLIQGRINMLESQRFFQLGQDIGEKGTVIPTFKCSDASYIQQVNDYYNQSLNYFLSAVTLFDELLTRHEESREYIGIDETKIRFFLSKVEDLSFEVRRNEESLKKYCNIN